MKTIMYASAALLLTSVANAQFLAKHLEPDHFVAMECAVTRVTPPDHDRDPGYKVLVSYGFQEGGKISAFEATHVTASGKSYRRSDQYPNATLTEGRDTIQWSGWWRYGNKFTTGTLHLRSGRYDEQIKSNGRIISTIDTICHFDHDD
jgi:hypothetical protein